MQRVFSKKKLLYNFSNRRFTRMSDEDGLTWSKNPISIFCRSMHSFLNFLSSFCKDLLFFDNNVRLPTWMILTIPRNRGRHFSSAASRFPLNLQRTSHPATHGFLFSTGNYEKMYKYDLVSYFQ
jgi:hypothetical protein